jgi:hypothetical protein
MLLQALLGLEADALNKTLYLRPSLPPWLGRIRYTNLRVAGTRVGFEVRRTSDGLHVEVLDDGGLRIDFAGRRD